MVGEIVDADRFRGDHGEPSEGRQEPADQPPADAGRSWHTNQTNSVGTADGGYEEFDDDRELPTPGDVASRFYEEHYELAKLPLTRQHGRSIRSELIEYDTERETTDAPKPEEDPFEIEYIDGKNPVTWGEAVVRLLQDHEDLRNTMLHLERGEPGDPQHATFDTAAESRFMSSYQKKYFAQLKGCLREFTGVGERPSGESPQGTMENPKLVLLTRTASSVPDGDRLAPVDFFDELSQSWSDGVYDALRNQLEKRLGLDNGTEWVYDRRLEPHPGDGSNQCYPHEHIVLLVDSETISPSDFRPIIDTHVDLCDAAGPGAHHLDVEDWDANREDVGTISIRDPDQIDNLAGYIADYASIQPNDLLERETDYVAFAAAAWATSTRTITRSDPMVHASTADRCKQRFEDGACDQELDHAEEIRREEIRGKPTLVCSECGSPHGIDQSQTLIEARSPDTGNGPSVVADGGRDWIRERKDELRERWPSAREVAAVGEQPTRTSREIRTPNDREDGKPISDGDIRMLIRALGKGVRRPEWMKAGWILEEDPRYQPDPDDPDLYVANERAPDLEDSLVDIVVFLNDCHSIRPNRIDEILQQVRANYNPNDEVATVEQPPSWRLDAVTIQGERHSVSSEGGGVDMESTDLSGDLLMEWVLQRTDLEEMAAESGGRLQWRGWYQNYKKVARYVAERAGASVERCEHIIEEFVSVPSRPDPYVDPGCWECGGTYEGDHAAHEWECWNCGDTWPMD